MNSHLRIALLFSFLLLLISSAQVSAQENASLELIEYVVIGESANLRAAPNTNSAVVDVVSQGDTVLIYDEEPEVTGWLRVYRDNEDDAYIAEFLVERAPQRFYSLEQEPVVVAEGRGKDITDILDIPSGIYRIDALVEDNAFILKSTVIQGECRDTTVFNELDFNAQRLVISGLFISQGCSIIFETDNVDGDWSFEIRNVLDEEFLTETIVEIEDGFTISGYGRSMTMPTLLPEGVWEIQAEVQSGAFILYSRPLSRDCDENAVFNEFVASADSLSASTVYRSGGCIVFWETLNVRGSWEITFVQLR